MPPGPLPDIAFGKFPLRVREAAEGGSHGIVVGQGGTVLHGHTRDEIIEKLRRTAVSSGREFIGFDGARRRFLERYPDGFASEDLVGRRGGEIYDKRMASLLIQAKLPIPTKAENPFDVDKVIRAFRAGKMVDRFDIDALAEALKEEKGSQLYWLFACLAMDGMGLSLAPYLVLKKYFDGQPVANWSIFTYLAAMWRPDTRAYMPRTAAKVFARFVGHPFAELYESRPTRDVYVSYLQMLDEARESLADLPVPPKDYIDLESYVHLVARELS